MIPTLVAIGIWSSIVAYVHIYHHSLSVDSLLITVTGEFVYFSCGFSYPSVAYADTSIGLVTSLVLGFRVNSAYERYSEGRYVLG